jgi:MEMO1 family protein
MWFPNNKKELNEMIERYLFRESKVKIPKNIKGIIVPHAGYEYSGEVAASAYRLLKEKRIKRAIIIGPSHYAYSEDAHTHYSDIWFTPLGEIKTFNKGFQAMDLTKEHSIANQIPFLQKVGIKEIMPLMIGDVTLDKAKEIAEKISDIEALYVFSTDLSHFLPYDDAKKIDKETIEIIKKLDIDNFRLLDACGIYPLLVLMYLCKIKKAIPKLIEYKNSVDITGEKSQVVGYASFWF